MHIAMSVLLFCTMGEATAKVNATLNNNNRYT